MADNTKIAIREANARELLRDALSVSVIKSKGEKYLPKPKGMGADLYNDTYGFNADFPLALPEAINSMLGMAFRKEPEYELGALEEDSLFLNGIVDYSSKILKESLLTGCGVLVDYQEGKSKLVYYDDSAVKDIKRDGNELVYIKLAETINKRVSKGEWESETQHLHYELLDGTVISWRTGEDESDLGEEIEIKGVGNNSLSSIPFVFFSATELNNKEDELPLEELARAARTWYYLDAEFKIGLYFVKPQPYVVNADNPPTSLGGGTMWNISGNDIKVGYLQADPVGFEYHFRAKDETRARMQAAAAKVIDVQHQESGESRGRRQSDQRATLAVVVETVGKGITRLLKFAAQFEGKSDNVSFDLSKEFEVKEVDAQMMRNVIDSAAAGITPNSVVYDALRKAGATDLDDEEIKKRLDDQEQAAFADEDDERTVT